MEKESSQGETVRVGKYVRRNSYSSQGMVKESSQGETVRVSQQLFKLIAHLESSCDNLGRIYIFNLK
jgi:hypothetical protein